MEAAVLAGLRAVVGIENVLTDRQELRTYECDGLTAYRAVPEVAVLVRDAGQVAAVLRVCSAHGVPFVARGAGTGLSGGALPVADGVLVVMSPLRNIVEIDIANQRATLEPGVANLDISKAARPHGYYYAPDPSSQQICSIGGNVAENSGGAHCLKYGFTAHHVTGLTVVSPAGDTVQLGGGKSLDPPGYDLMGVFIGSEGTLGVATQVTVRLLPVPEVTHTLLAGFGSTNQAGAAVSAIIAAGVIPSAIEMMDALAIEAAEAAVACNYPSGAGAVLIVELDGPAEEVLELQPRIARMCRDAGATEIRTAEDADDRARIWKGRKSAFAAVGRISPDYIVQDGVVPRNALAPLLTEIGRLAEEHGVRVANVFHAGDGNLHPLVLYDASIAGAAAAAEDVSAAILEACILAGGSITGEHGVGIDKARYLPAMFSPVDLDTMQMIRCAFDPERLANPGKVFPTPRLCGEPPRRRSAADGELEVGLAELF
jgi:glycolate oxidase